MNKILHSTFLIHNSTLFNCIGTLMRIQKLVFLFTILLTTAPLSAGEIVINEIMYNADGSDVEYVELYNNGSSAVNLSSWYILDDNDSHTHCVLSGNLAAGAYLVIPGNYTIFQVAYPSVSNVLTTGFSSGSDAWALGNGGDAVRLFNASGELVDIVAYDDEGDWPNGADGGGPSLELLNPGYDNSAATSWRSSSTDGGTPGTVNSVYTEDAAPVCKDGYRTIDLPTNSVTVPVCVYVYDLEGLSSVSLMVSTGGSYSAISMTDDGSNSDETAGDSIYTGIIPAYGSGTLVKYYVIAEDLSGQTDYWPNDAPQDYRAYTVDYTPPALMITEVMAANKSTIADEYSEYDDWFEIYNNDSQTISLDGMYVSSSLKNSMAFELPDVDLGAGEYLVIWADNDTEQGSLHTDFKLQAAGEAVGLFETTDHGNVLIHGWTYGVMTDDISMGFPTAASNAPEYLATPTPGSSNATSTLYSDICINEFECTSNFGGYDDWIEIFNRGALAIDLSGCFLSDNIDELTKWTFPSGTTLAAGDYLVIYEDALGFSSSSSGDEVIALTASDSVTGLDYFDYDEQTADHSQGRYPDGVSTWYFFNNPSEGTTNTDPSGITTGTITNLPGQICLYPNYPNPCNPTTTIAFTLPDAYKVKLAVYDMLGKEVAVIADGQFTSGYHTVTWSARNLASGFYFYRLTSGSVTKTGKMILLK